MKIKLNDIYSNPKDVPTKNIDRSGASLRSKRLASVYNILSIIIKINKYQGLEAKKICFELNLRIEIMYLERRVICVSCINILYLR